MVPNGWSLVKLGDILTLGSGDTKPADLQKEYSDDSPYPVYGGNNIMGYSSQKNSSDSVILIGRVGEYCGVTRYIDKACWITDNALYTKTVSSEIDKEYLVSKLKKFDLSRLRNKGGQPLVSQKPIYAVKLPMPPLSEQRKIAQILSTWDRGIATTEKLIDASKQQKKALMQQLLTGKKRLIDPETGKAFEGEWERHSLSDLVYVDRKSLGKKTPDNFKFKYISLSNVDFGVISKELEVHEFSAAPSRARRVLQDGDILMSTVRPNLKGFAKVTSCYADCIASTGFAVLTPKKKVSGDYIYQYIFSAHVTGQIDSLVVGSNYPAINSSDVSGLKVYCPAFEEQQKIASVLTAADKEIELLEAKLAHLKQEKKALMQQLLTGKRRVKVAETEAA
ncbi:TPA: restriction endonuclease subunit S [Vibrio parahaemolyticus]|nr:restriction endonuclease subunit S [Vibrio parahaemolyticus]